jgi:hypothetical protein
MYDAAANGDTKAALDVLKHQHGWVAKQHIDVSVDQQISILGALERAQTRVIEGLYTEVPQLEDKPRYANAPVQFIRRDGVDDASMVAND